MAQKVASLRWGYGFEQLVGPPLSEAALARALAPDTGEDDMAEAVARQSLSLAGRCRCAAVPLSAALQARALARLGMTREARQALDTAEHGWQKLDRESQAPSAFGYNEAQLRFPEGNAYTHLNDIEAAQAAQQRALDLYPHSDFLDRAMVKLDGAAYLIRAGQVEEAIHRTAKAVLGLTGDQRRGLILARGREILQSVPLAQRTMPAGRDLTDLLALVDGEESL